MLQPVRLCMQSAICPSGCRTHCSTATPVRCMMLGDHARPSRKASDNGEHVRSTRAVSMGKAAERRLLADLSGVKSETQLEKGAGSPRPRSGLVCDRFVREAFPIAHRLFTALLCWRLSLA